MQVSALETQKSIYSQTNPSPPPSCCIQADIWPVISPSVEETCGHLMTPTGVMHAIAQDGAMTVSFNISLYILCEMRGTLRSSTLCTGHCRLSGKEHTCSVEQVGHGHVFDLDILINLHCILEEEKKTFYRWYIVYTKFILEWFDAYNVFTFWLKGILFYCMAEL